MDIFHLIIEPIKLEFQKELKKEAKKAVKELNAMMNSWEGKKSNINQEQYLILDDPDIINGIWRDP